MKNELPTALVAADVCVFKIVKGMLCVYVTNVTNNEHYLGKKCLPGSLIRLDENAEDTVKRVLTDRTNIPCKDVYLEQLYSFSDVGRDKRSRSVAIAYLGLLDASDSYGDEMPEKGSFVPLHEVKNLAFDHKEIIKEGLERLRNKFHYSTIIKKLLRGEFTFAELQKVYELILGKPLDKRNFRKKFMSLDVIKETDTYKKEGRMRPAMMYQWKSNKVEPYDVLGFVDTK